LHKEQFSNNGDDCDDDDDDDGTAHRIQRELNWTQHLQLPRQDMEERERERGGGREKKHCSFS
jgi:hypothetical protein